METRSMVYREVERGQRLVVAASLWLVARKRQLPLSVTAGCGCDCSPIRVPTTQPPPTSPRHHVFAFPQRSRHAVANQLEHPYVLELAAKYGKTPAQVCYGVTRLRLCCCSCRLIRLAMSISAFIMRIHDHMDISAHLIRVSVPSPWIGLFFRWHAGADPVAVGPGHPRQPAHHEPAAHDRECHSLTLIPRIDSTHFSV